MINKYTNLGNCFQWIGRWAVNFNLCLRTQLFAFTRKSITPKKNASKRQFPLLSDKTTILALCRRCLEWRASCVKQIRRHCFHVISTFIPLCCPIQRVRYTYLTSVWGEMRPSRCDLSYGRLARQGDAGTLWALHHLAAAWPVVTPRMARLTVAATLTLTACIHKHGLVQTTSMEAVGF